MGRKEIIMDEWRKRRVKRRAPALSVLANDQSRTRAEHAREVWMKYIRTPLGDPREVNTSSIEDVSQNALTVVLNLMRFTRPNSFKGI